jgi:uncharacterized protein
LNANTQRLLVLGPAGQIEVAWDDPIDPQTPHGGAGLKGVAVIAHPHPLHGGTMDNKVVQTLARAFMQAGWRAVRFNFRGVGRSEGTFDEGRGETQDAWAVIQAARSMHAAPNQGRSLGPALALAGFSFGGYVAAQAASQLANTAQPDARPLDTLVLIGPATSRFSLPTVQAPALIIHGEDDEVVPLSSTLAWARPQGLPVVVAPGVGHFFHGKLPLLKRLVVQHLVSLDAVAFN